MDFQQLNPLLAGLSFVHLQGVIALAIFVVQLLGFWLALRAILTSRVPQAAIGWTLGLVILPWIAIPLYLVFGQSKFTGYTLAGHGVIPELDRLKHEAKVAMEAHRCQFLENYSDLTKLSERLTGLHTVSGNKIELLIDGRQTFDAILGAIREAKETVLMQFYVIHDDRIGREVNAELIRALSRGVRVYLLFDGVGSKHLPWEYCEELRQAGAKVAPFVTNRKLGVRFQINFRNHRKLVVVDGRIAFTGGLNIGDEYMGLSPRFGPWRDTHISLEGPAILPLLVGFYEDWHYATGTVLDVPVPPVREEGSINVLSFVSGPADEVEVCPVIYLGAIREARRRIWIASPYFVPDSATRMALQHAALRGVDVRVLLPGMADHTLPWLTSYSYYPSMKLAGVQLFRMREGFMHQKVLLVDNDLAMVGSINFDHRSFLLNFEHAVMACDQGFALRIQQMLEADFANSKEEDLTVFERASIWFRLKVRLAALASPEQ